MKSKCQYLEKCSLEIISLTKNWENCNHKFFFSKGTNLISERKYNLKKESSIDWVGFVWVN